MKPAAGRRQCRLKRGKYSYDMLDRENAKCTTRTVKKDSPKVYWPNSWYLLKRNPSISCIAHSCGADKHTRQRLCATDLQPCGTT